MFPFCTSKHSGGWGCLAAAANLIKAPVKLATVLAKSVAGGKWHQVANLLHFPFGIQALSVDSFRMPLILSFNGEGFVASILLKAQQLQSVVGILCQVYAPPC